MPKMKYLWRQFWQNTPETELLEDCIPYALDEMILVVKKEINEVTFEPETEDGTKEWLRYYHYEMENGRHGYLFFNESLTCKIKGSVHFPDVQKLYSYDAYENKLYCASHMQTDQIPLELYGGETKIYITGDMEEMVGEQELDAAEEQIQWSAFLGKVTISTADYRDMSSFRKIQEMDLGETDGNMDLPKSLENGFSGILRYELELWGSGEGRCFLDLGQVREAVQVWVNGEEAGTRIGDPFQFEITPWIKKGKNKIRMEVATRLVYALRDSASKYMVLLPEGIHGPIRIGSLL